MPTRRAYAPNCSGSGVLSGKMEFSSKVALVDGCLFPTRRLRANVAFVYTCGHVCVHMGTNVCMHMSNAYTHVCICLCLYVYAYIYVYVERERERERQTDRQRQRQRQRQRHRETETETGTQTETETDRNTDSFHYDHC